MKPRSILAMGVILLMLGCSRVTLENYNKLTVGMRYEEVIELLGSPATCDDMMGVRACQWGDERRSINVNFIGGKVLLFSSSNLQ
jgi:hypothetical protein